MIDRDPCTLYPHQWAYYWFREYGPALAIGILLAVLTGMTLLVYGKVA